MKTKRSRRKAKYLTIEQLAMKSILARHVATQIQFRSMARSRFGRKAADQAIASAKETLSIVGL